MIRRPPRSTQSRSSAASDVYKRQATARVAGLDAGQRRRAAIAAGLLAAPALLLLEEPAAGLDLAQSTEVMRLLRRLCDGGTTVVLTTSSPLDAARCDKIAVLSLIHI